ncbi:hypothetical protein V6N13_087278 [Hibiscus sabdariffa]|uniref:Uncharacterized protein n=1 Tax=Hibiscus sabdariffa TaxID=183260 RepID=A0ABR2FVQ1_9ROSI
MKENRAGKWFDDGESMWFSLLQVGSFGACMAMAATRVQWSVGEQASWHPGPWGVASRGLATWNQQQY